MIKIINGDSRQVLKQLPAESFNCCVTSPPYWGLRDYGVSGQVGLEKTPEEYVNELVLIFREVGRVLKSNGTLWLNLGDSYAGSGGAHAEHHANPGLSKSHERDGVQHLDFGRQGKTSTISKVNRGRTKIVDCCKQKDLVGIPWRVAFALQADGWYLRSDIIWSKPNPMPESVRDRPTKAHEYIFLLTRQPKYYYDADAIKEKAVWFESDKRAQAGPTISKRSELGVYKCNRQGCYTEDGMRNKRSVWEVCTQPFPEAHFATFPPELIEPCILAGCPVGGEVIDPFGGAGTTALVSDRLNRNCTIIELNKEYCDIAENRIRSDCPMFVEIERVQNNIEAPKTDNQQLKAPIETESS